MRIEFITSSLGYGGAAKMLVFVAESLQQRGHDVEIINLKSTSDVTNYERNVSPYIKVRYLKSRKKIQQIIEILKTAKKFNTDIFIGFTSFPNLYAVICGKILRRPSIISERGDPKRNSIGSNWIKFKSIIMSHIINMADGGVFQTEGAMECYGRKLREKGVIIANPIEINNIEEYIPAGDRNKTIVSVGRLDNYQKRYDVMFEGFRLFLRSHPNYKLLLYGRGNDEEQIKHMAKDLGLENSVFFMGLSKNPIKDIYKEGIFLITSDFEGISNSLLEAMAIGMPCVSTDHSPGGARLLIQDSVNGLLVPIRNPQSICHALERLADDQDFANRCGENARNVLKIFSPEQIIDKWESYIQTIRPDPRGCLNGNE